MEFKNRILGECRECSKDEDVVNRGGNVDFLNPSNRLCWDCEEK